MTALIGSKRRPLDPAAVDRVGAARVKVASGRRRQRTWNITLQQLPLPPRMRLRDGNRGEQGAGIGMAWIGEQLIRRRSFDDAAEIHDRDPVRDMFDHRKIVRNENVSERKAPAQAREQIEHLRANRNIESRHRLVTNNKFWFNRERSRDGNSLPLAAGEFVRVSLTVSRIEADEAQKLGHAIAAAGAGTILCRASGSAISSPTVIRGLSDE